MAEIMQQYQKKLPQCISSLLTHCPPEACSIRRELLIAIRHLFGTEFRKGIIDHVRSHVGYKAHKFKVDNFLSEDLLVGKGRTCRDSLRPLVYSVLADLLHQVRTALSRPQLSKVVYIFSRNIHDSALPLNMQAMSAKLLMNLVECIEKDQQGMLLARLST